MLKNYVTTAVRALQVENWDHRPFNAFFLDDDYDRQYQAERRIGAILSLFTGLAAMIIAWMTVSYQSLRTALIDPVDALRYQ